MTVYLVMFQAVSGHARQPKHVFLDHQAAIRAADRYGEDEEWNPQAIVLPMLIEDAPGKEGSIAR